MNVNRHEEGRAYDGLAAAYVRWYATDAAWVSWTWLVRLLPGGLALGAKVLDLCCGAGHVTARLVAAGYRVHGVDASAGMLRYARERAPEATFEQAELRRWRPEERYDAVVCTYNSLAHLTAARDFARVLRQVRRALAPGGAFIFDLYDDRAYRTLWRGSHRLAAPDGLSCELVARYDRQRRRGENDIVVRQGARRNELQLRTRCYTARELGIMLRAAGFGPATRARSSRGRVFYRVGLAEAPAAAAGRTRTGMRGKAKRPPASSTALT